MLTKVEYKPVKVEGEVNYVSHTGPPYYEYGVRFLDPTGRSLGYMQCGWSTSKRSADALMRSAVERMAVVVNTTSGNRKDDSSKE